MIYIHKDIIYTRPHYKFIKRILDDQKISNTIIDAHDLDFINSLDIKDDDILIARFAHDKEDKIKTSKVFPTLTKKFKTMFPSGESYYYYDDKLRQYEFMVENDIPCLETHHVTCKEDIEKLNINFPIVTKKTWGAGSEQVNYFETLDSIVDNTTTRSWTQESIYPCLVQEYQDVDYDLRVMLFDSKFYMYKRIHKWKTVNKDNFPYGTEKNSRKKILKYRYPPYKEMEVRSCDDEECKNVLPTIHKLLDIQRKKLNTYYMSWDLLKVDMEYKVLEFSVISTTQIPRNYYDLKQKKILKNKKRFFAGIESLVNQYIK